MVHSVFQKRHMIIVSFVVLFAMLFAGVGGTAMAEESGGVTLKITVGLEGSYVPEEALAIQEDLVAWLRFSGDEESLIADLNLDYSGESMLSVLTQISKDKILFQIPEVDETVYLMSSETAAEPFSQFFQMLQVNTHLAGAVSSEEMEEAAKAYAEAFTPIFTTISEHVKADSSSMENVSIQLESTRETVDGCLANIYKPNAEQIQSMILDLADTIEADEALDLVAQQIAEGLRNGPAAVSSEVAMDGEELQQVIYVVENARVMLPMYLRDNASTIAQSMDQAGFEIDLVSSEEAEVKCFGLSIGDGGPQPIRVTMEMTGPETEHDIFFAVYQGNEMMLSMGTNKTVDAGQSNGDIQLYMPSSGMSVNVSYSADKEHSSALGLPYGDYKLYMNGLFSGSLHVESGSTEGADQHDIVLSVLNGSSAQNGIDTISISAESTRESTAVAPQGTIVDISGYSDDQIEDLFEELGGKISQHLNNYPIMTNTDTDTPSGFSQAFSSLPKT